MVEKTTRAFSASGIYRLKSPSELVTVPILEPITETLTFDNPLRLRTSTTFPLTVLEDLASAVFHIPEKAIITEIMKKYLALLNTEAKKERKVNSLIILSG